MLPARLIISHNHRHAVIDLCQQVHKVVGKRVVVVDYQRFHGVQWHYTRTLRQARPSARSWKVHTLVLGAEQRRYAERTTTFRSPRGTALATRRWFLSAGLPPGALDVFCAIFPVQTGYDRP